MKILFVVTSVNSGGIENYLLRFLTHFQAEIKATVLCKSGVYGELYQDYKNIEDSTITNFKLSFLNPFHYFKLYFYLKKNQFDGVCDFTGNFSGLILLVVNIVGVKKRVAFYRGSEDHFKSTILKNIYNKCMNWLVLKNATDILSNSKEAISYFFHSNNINNNNKFDVIYNGIDIDKFANVPKSELNLNLEGKFVVGHSGRLHYSKNHDTILKIAKAVITKNPNIVFILIGKDTESLQSEIKLENLESNVYTLGYRKDVSGILKNLDLFLFPSITEGQPNALIEAMSLNIPIIASNIPTIKETLPDNFHHDLINPLDYERFANQILRYYNNQEDLNNMKFGNWVLERFNAEVQFTKFKKILNE